MEFDGTEYNPKHFLTIIDCISMYEPWAMWVALGWKTIETRRHNKLACLARRGKRIVIHAAQKIDWAWIKKAGPYLSNEQLLWTSGHILDWPRGALICTAQPVGHYRLGPSSSILALCDCSGCDLFGLALKIHGEPKFDPIPWKGHQGIMKVPEEVIRNA